MPKQCLNCYHWNKWRNQFHPQFVFGDCRINAPKNFQLPDGRFSTKWPSTTATDVCGEFVAFQVHD